MQSPPLRRGGPVQAAETFTFDAPLDNEEAVLDAIIAAMVRGALPAGVWDRLDAAAQRDERTSELAFAFEAAAQGKRLRTVAPAVASDFLFRAGKYFADVFGDEVAGLTHLERALAATPTHAASFAKTEQLLLKLGQPKKLAELYAVAAQHSPRAEQPELLRRAANLLSQGSSPPGGGSDDRVIELLQHALRLEPGDEATRAQLEALCIKANRLRDVVRMNEQALGAEPPPDEPTRKRLLLGIVALYADKLHEPERAMPHVEQLLAIDPASEPARRVAEKLVVVRGLAGRAAAALANAYEAVGGPQDVARYVAIELENTRGPRRAALLARLGKLKGERLGDDAGAFEALEQALAIDAVDDALRTAYVSLARKLGRYPDAAKTLGRVHATAKTPAAKAMAAAQLGEMLLRAGDAKRAKVALASVLAAGDAPAAAVLAAARVLGAIHDADGDARGMVDVLERIATLETDEGERQAADERLAVLATEVGDRARAIAAYERLLPTGARARALAALAPLYEAGGDPEKHARLLEEQAKDLADPAEARPRMMRAAEVRVQAGADVEQAIASCRSVLDRFGPARDAHALLLPLLETQRRWPELGRLLADEAALTTGADHAQVMVRLGALRVQRLGDAAGAIEAFGEALSIEPGDKTARLMLEKLAASGEHRLDASRVLEPLYRRQGANGSLLKVLELRGALEPGVDERLAALREAARLANGAEAGRAAELIGRALADAVAYHRPLGEWLERLDAATAAGTDAKRRAAILGRAIGDHPVTTDDLGVLARRAAAAHASAGDIHAAIALYQRALAFEPHSSDLLSLIDDLLRDQGSPQDRVALYRAALARGASPARRRELLHGIGAIERDDLADPAAAIATFRAALEDDADDAGAQAALEGLYASGQRWDDLYALLEARLVRAEGHAAHAIGAQLAGLAAAHGDVARARTHAARLLEARELSPEHLDAVSRAVEVMDDAGLERAVLQRRAEAAEEARDQIAWLDRLGELEEQRLDDRPAAAIAWKRAAALASAAGDDELARRLYGRARNAAPDDREVSAHLVRLCEGAQLWQELPALYVALGEQTADTAERVELWSRAARVLAERLGDPAGAAHRAASVFALAPERADVLAMFEAMSMVPAADGLVDVFERAVNDVLERLGATGALPVEQRARLLLSRARALAGDPRRADDGARAYRAILEAIGDDAAAEAPLVAGTLAAFEALIAADPGGPARRDDRRWLFAWRAEHAPEEERAARLLDWAREEESLSAEPAQALALYRRVLAIDAEVDEALVAVSRLALAAGDIEGALTALGARRDRADGPPRVAIELEIAEVILSHTTRHDEGLASLRAVLADAPGDARARALAVQLLGHGSTRDEALRMLDRACDAADDPATRAQVLTSLLEPPASGALAEARRGWFERLCDLQREQGSLAAAMATAARAVREMPDVETLWDRADALARLLSGPEDMAALYEEVLARPVTREQARVIGARAVQFCEEWFEDSARVVRILERVLALEPTAEWAFDRLKLLLDAGERWDELFALYDRVLESAGGPLRATLLEDAAQTAKDFADRPDRAIHYLEQLSKLRPADTKLTGALERLYERQGRHQELVALLTARLPTLQGDEARHTRARIATLWLEGLGDPGAAFDVIEPVLDGAGPAENGRTPNVWMLLEQILAAAPPVAPVRTSTAPPAQGSDRPPRSRRARKSSAPAPARAVRQLVAGRLRQRYAQTGRDADLVRMLLVELEAVKTPKDRVRRHLEIAETYEKLGDAGNALEQVGHAMVIDPPDEAKRAKLAELAERTGRLSRFADLLTAAAEASDDGRLRISLTMQAAGIRADRVADAPGAIALLSSVLGTPGLRDDDLLTAGRRLEALLEAAGREGEQLDVLERVAGVDPDAVTRREAFGRAARLGARLGQPERAIALWEKRVASEPEDAEALDGLVGLLEQTGHDERLAAVLELRARAATSDAGRRADRVRVATLVAGPLGRPGDAIVAWRRIEHDFGEADDVELALAALLRATQGWSDLATLLERGAARAADGPARADLLGQLGDVHREKLEAPAAAVETYARALEADPGSPRARAGLLVLSHDGALRAAAVGFLLKALRASDDWRAALDLTPHRLLAAGSDAEKIAVLLETAQIAERRAESPSMAFDAMRQAFVIAPHNEGVEREAVRLAGSAGAWQRLVDAYREAIEGAARSDRELVARLRANAGATLETRLDDPGGALEAYLQVVGDTSDVGAGCAALRVAGRLDRWDVAAGVVVDVARAHGAASPELFDAYGQAADAAGRWQEAARALTSATSSAALAGRSACDIEARIAGWYLDRLGDPDAAQAATERALAHDEANAGLLARLVDLRRRHRGRPLVDALLRLSAATGGDPALLREAAEVARESAADPGLAREILTDLLGLARARWQDGASGDPAAHAAHAEWAIESLARLHEEGGDPHAVANVLEQGDALPFDRDVRRGMRRRAARIALDRLGDHERAIGLYLALFDDDPHDEEAAQRLASAYLAHGLVRDLLRLRERQIAVAGDAAIRVALRLEVAQLLVHLGEGARAAQVLADGLAEDPRHEGTVEALAAVFAAHDRTRDWIDLLVDQAQRAEADRDARRAADLWGRAAALAEDRLADPAAAETYHARVAALEVRPGSLDALGRLATARGDHHAAAQWLERLLGVVHVDGRVDATLRLADALVGAGERSRATERLSRSLVEVGPAEPLRERLAGLYREQGDWERLAALTADAAAHAPDKATRMARLCQAARLFVDRCGQPALAVPLLEQAADLAPDDQAAALALADALAQSGRFDDARSMLKAMIDAFGGRRPKERAPAHYQMARLELATGNRARALVELDMAARVDPQNPDILRALAELARDDGQLQRAEKSYRALLVVLRRRTDGGEAQNVARSEVLLELAAIAQRQGESDRANEILESALEAATKGDFEQERLEAALRARGDHATLVRVLEARLARVGDAPVAARALGELAELLADRLDRPDHALTMRLRAVAMDPRSDAAHDAALALARAHGGVARYVTEAVALADEAVARGDVELARGLFVRLGGAAELDLRDDPRAAVFYERAVDLGPGTAEAFVAIAALDGVFDRLGDVQKRAHALSMRIDAETRRGGPKAASDAVYRLAALRLGSRDTFDEGVEMLREALEIEPRLDAAGAALHRAVAIDPTHAGVVALYEHVGRQPGNERTLVDALRVRAELPGADADTVREAVEMAVGAGERAQAESLLERVVMRERAAGENPARLAWALDALANVRHAAGDPAKAVELKQAAARIADPEIARKLTFEVARIAADELGDWAVAAEAYEGLRRADPADREAWEPLAAVYRRQGDARKLADLLVSVADLVDDTSLRARLRLERVRAMEGLGLTDAEAAPLLREIVDDDAAQVDAALMLGAILERSGAHDELIDLLARQIDAARDRADAPSIVSLSLRLGALVEATNPVQARNAYYTALEWGPQSRELLDALLRVLDGEADVAERADVCERRLAIEVGAAAEEMALALSAVRVQLGDEAGAERAFEIGYRADPTSALLRGRLEGSLRDRGEWAKLAELCMVDASTRAAPAERVARLREAASIRTRELGDFRGAAEALRLARAAAETLDDGARAIEAALLREHVAVLLEAGDPAAAVSQLSDAIDRLAADSPRRAELLAERAGLRSANGDADGDSPAGLDDLEAAFAIDRATHAIALAGRLGRACAEALRSGDAPAVRLFRLRCAQVLPFADDADGARAILVELLQQDAKDVAALRALASLEAGRERWDAASAALKRLVGLEEAEGTVDTALRLADACERAGRPADARGALERARIVAPLDRAVRQRLGHLYEEMGAWRELAELVLEDARASSDVADRFPLLLRAGSLMLERASDPRAGIDALEEARALRPTDPECVALLADAYTLSGRPEDAAALLEPVLAPHKGRRVRELAPLYWRSARVARYAGNSADEVRALFQALECDTQNGTVCADVALRAIDLEQLELASRALRAITLLKTPGPMSKAVAYQHMGEIARKQGDSKRALMLLNRALAEDPSLDGARAIVEAIERDI
jgi:golgin subfamily B member 1